MTGFGPYFVSEPRLVARKDGASDWRPLSDLLDGDVVAERVGVARQTLVELTGLNRDDIDERAVASITFLGLASRLLSPPLAAAVVEGAVPVPDRLWWRPVPGGPIPIAYDGLTAVECGEPSSIADVLTSTATQRLVAPLLEAYRRRFSVSPQVMWGNVASALGGAAGMIADAAPEHAARAAAVVEAALDRAPLRGMATLVRPDPARARWFLVRRNCCLYYRIPGGGTCGDCVLTPEPVRRQQWQSVLSR